MESMITVSVNKMVTRMKLETKQTYIDHIFIIVTQLIGK